VCLLASIYLSNNQSSVFMLQSFQTPHYTVSVSDYHKKFKHLLADDIQGPSTKYYSRKISYTQDGFIRIWNVNTPEFDDIKGLYHKIDFKSLFSSLDPKEVVSTRGNVQHSFGYSQQNITGRDEDGISCPKVNNGIRKVKGSMVAMSKIGIQTNVLHHGKEDDGRIGLFAGKIDKQNIIEGFTIAYTTHGIKKKQLQNILPHVDNYNSNAPNFNYLMIGSSIGLLNNKGSGPGTDHEYCRVAAIAYGRKSIDDYYSRRSNFHPILNLLETFHNSLPNVQKVLDSNVLSNTKVCAIIEKECLVRPAHLHKSCYLSAYVYALRLAAQRFGFSLEQIVECTLPMGFGTEPYKICSTLLYWVKMGRLPPGNLTISLLSEMGSNMMGFGSGARPRHQIKCTKTLTGEDVFSGLRRLRHLILYCNTINIPLHSETKILELYRYCLREMKGVFYLGSLGSQHVISILSMARVIKHVGLSTVAIVGHGTGSYNKLTKELNILPAQLDGLLKTIAIHFNCNRAVAENLLCEAFRKRKAFDFQFPGQSIYDPVLNNQFHEVKEYLPSGQEQIVSVMRFQKPIFKRHHVNWWDPHRVNDIPHKYRSIKIEPTTKDGRTPIVWGKAEVHLHKALILQLIRKSPSNKRLREFRCGEDGIVNKQKKQITLAHSSSTDVCGSITNMIINDSPLDKLPIDTMELLPQIMFSKKTISEKQYKFETQIVGIVYSGDNTVSQGMFSKLVVSGNVFDYSTKTGNWKPRLFSLGDHSDSCGSICHLYQRKKHANRCALLGHLAFSNECGKEAMSERKKFVTRCEIRNKTIIDIHDGQSKDRLFVLHRSGLTVDAYFPMRLVPDQGDSPEYTYHMMKFCTMSSSSK
jgi:hypothetical protein